MSDDAPVIEAPIPAVGDSAPEIETPAPAPIEIAPDIEAPAPASGDAAPAAVIAAPPAPGTLTGAFRAFYDHYGPGLCGEPLDRVDEGGVPTQYFRNLALEELEPGVVRLKPLGEAWLARQDVLVPAYADGDAPAHVDMVDRLPRDPAQAYPNRPLSDIRYLVIHHTGAPEDVNPHRIAREHVEQNGWPGIGYHYVIGTDGTRYRTQDLTAVSYHAAQFNPAAVGIALAGDWTQAVPPPAQLVAAAVLLAELCADLGLPFSAIRGHREMVPTGCPGELFLSAWKPRLVAIAAERLAADAARSAMTAQAEPDADRSATVAQAEPDAGSGASTA